MFSTVISVEINVLSLGGRGEVSLQGGNILRGGSRGGTHYMYTPVSNIKLYQTLYNLYKLTYIVFSIAFSSVISFPVFPFVLIKFCLLTHNREYCIAVSSVCLSSVCLSRIIFICLDFWTLIIYKFLKLITSVRVTIQLNL